MFIPNFIVPYTRQYEFSTLMKLGSIYLQHYPTGDPTRREQIPINSRGVTVFTTDHLAKQAKQAERRKKSQPSSDLNPRQHTRHKIFANLVTNQNFATF